MLSYTLSAGWSINQFNQSIHSASWQWGRKWDTFLFKKMVVLTGITFPFVVYSIIAATVLNGEYNVTVPDGLLHITVWEGSIQNHLKRAGTLKKILGWWLDKPPVCQGLSWTDFDHSEQQTIRPAEQLGKSNSESVTEERKHLFYQENPSVSVSALLSMKKYSPVLIELMLQQHLH